MKILFSADIENALPLWFTNPIWFHIMDRGKTRSLSPRTSVASSLNLASLRQKKDISLEQIAEATKISIRFLRAIENEEFNQLPGGIFNTSYLRQYAAAVGMDEVKLLAHYRRLNPGESEEAPARPAERSLFDRWFRIPAQLSRP